MKKNTSFSFSNSAFFFGLVIVIGGTIWLVSVLLKSHLWNDIPNSWKEAKSLVSECKASEASSFSLFAANLRKLGELQRRNWAQRMFCYQEELRICSMRIEILRNKLIESDDSDFLAMPQAYSVEQRRASEIRENMRKADVHTGKEGFAGLIIIPGVAIFLSLLVCKILEKTVREVLSINRFKWKLIYWAFTSILFTSWLLTFTITSILSTNKPWIGATSFFVSSEAWLIERFVSFGLAMIMAAPITLLWHYTKKDYIPSIGQINFASPDGKCGVGSYVAFIHSWSIVSIVAFAIIMATGLVYEGSFQYEFASAYLIPAFVGLCILLVMCYRTVRNALILRKRYWDKAASEFKRYENVKQSSIAPDPTLGFIGDYWWKLPVTWTGIIGTIWAIFKWMGIAEFITNAIK